MKTQLDRLKYIENNIHLDDLTKNELEQISDYILRGSGDNNKNYLPQRKLLKKINREHFDVIIDGKKENIIESEWLL